ncbi:MAG TPA: ABC transporter permease [Thermoanaerobaculia bacterium]|nr:ABC transporter permease [Thermoanaerobaculia bacterium]
MSNGIRDLKHTVSSLLADGTFTLVTLVTLALTLGANTAVFSVLSSVLLRPLPYPEPERLVTLYNSYPKVGIEVGANSTIDYFDRRQEDVFESVALTDSVSANLGLEGAPERVNALRATPSLFSVLKLQPLLGRALTEEDGVAGQERVVLLSERLWRRLYAGDRGVVGRDLRVNGVPYAIVGVAPDTFDVFEQEAELLLPWAFTDQDKSEDSRHSNFAQMVARLAPGRTVEEARQRLDAMNQRIIDRAPEVREMVVNAGYHTAVQGLHAEAVREVRPRLYLVQAGAILVLLIGCINVANLMVVRAGRRMRELGVRLALGAGRSRLARQMVGEAVLLTLVGAGLGLALAAACLQLFSRLGIDQLPRGAGVSLDGTALGFTFAVALGVGLTFGLIPVFQVARSNLADVFREGGRSGSAGRGAVATRSVLVVVQVAVAFVLLLGAGLLLASFQRTLAVDPGFEAERVLTAQISLPESRYAEPTRIRQTVEDAVARIGRLPGVERAAAVDLLPLTGMMNASVMTIEGHELAPGEHPPVPYFSTVSPGYFAAMGIPLLTGRAFDATDHADAQPVAIVDQRLAEKYWPGQSPLGKRLRPGLDAAAGADGAPAPPPWMTIVGVAGNIHRRGLDTPDTVGSLYLPLAQNPGRTVALVARTAGPPEALTSALRGEILALDPELPLFDVNTMEQRLDRSLIERKAPMTLIAAFAAIALFLAAIGIYGVLAYSVQLRTREIGVRSALGALPEGILKLVLGQGALLLGVGLAIGITAALLSGRLIRSFLFEVGPSDPKVVSVVAMALALVGLLACLAPSLKAARVDPVVALRRD